MKCNFLKVSITFALCVVAVSLVGAQTQIYPDIYADGSCNVNYAWEQGQVGNWYIELQREGGYAIEAGISTETDSYIQAGLQALSWGFGKQGPDGSFPGTGDPFHSTSLFVEEAAHALLALSQYQPVMGGATYGAAVAQYAPQLLLATQWLQVQSTIPSNIANEAPYTHRRYVLASAFAQVDALCTTTQFAGSADFFGAQGLALQRPDGVNPEKGGFDVEYQMVGIDMAQHMLAADPSDAMAPAIGTMIANGLGWEETMIDPAGTINCAGSTRVGVELNRNGTVKEPEGTMIEAVFLAQNALTPNYYYLQAYDRLVEPYYPGRGQTFAKDGAQSQNIPYDDSQASTYQLCLQHYGVEYLKDGLSRAARDPSNEGQTITNWGLDQQTANGFFGPTPAPPYNIGVFLESLYRSYDTVTNYQQEGVALATQYLQAQSAYKSALISAANAFNTPYEIEVAMNDEGQSTSHLWLLAATICKAGKLSHSAALYSLADVFASAALALQMPDGENPENGFVDYNGQAAGILYASEYINSTYNSTLSHEAQAMIHSATAFEIAVVSATGDVPNSSGNGASYYEIDNALKQDYSMEGGQVLAVVISRIETFHGVNQAY